MQAQQYASAFRGGLSNDLAAGTVSHPSNFVAACLGEVEIPPKIPGNLANVG